MSAVAKRSAVFFSVLTEWKEGGRTCMDLTHREGRP